MRLKLIYTALLLFVSVNSFSQIATRIDQYYIQPSIINTAAINSINGTSIDMFINKLFWGVNGSPENMLINISHHNFGKSAGFGGLFGMEKIGFVNHINGNLSYAYTLPSKSMHKFTFSPSVGFISEKLNASNINVIDVTDPVYQAFINDPKQTKFDLRLSGLYQFKGLMLGLSSSRLTSKNYGYEDNNGNNTLVPIKNLSNAFISTKLQMSKNLILQPVLSSTITDFKEAITQYGLNTIIANKLWAGLHNAGNKNIALNVGAIFKDALKLGYSYSMPYSNTSKTLGSGHEIVASYLFGNKVKPIDNYDKFVLNKTNDDEIESGGIASIDKEDVDNTLNTKNPNAQTENNKIDNVIDNATAANTKTVDTSTTVNTETTAGNNISKTTGNTNSTIPEIAVKPKLKGGEILVSSYEEAAEQIQLGKSKSLVLAPLPKQQPKNGYYLCAAFAKTESEIDAKVKELWNNGTKAFKIMNPQNGYYYAYVDKFETLELADAAKWSGKYNVPNIWTKLIK